MIAETSAIAQPVVTEKTVATGKGEAIPTSKTGSPESPEAATLMEEEATARLLVSVGATSLAKATMQTPHAQTVGDEAAVRLQPAALDYWMLQERLLRFSAALTSRLLTSRLAYAQLLRGVLLHLLHRALWPTESC